MKHAGKEATDGVAVIADELDSHEENERTLHNVDQIKRYTKAGLRRQRAVAQSTEHNGIEQNAHGVTACEDADKKAVPADAGVCGEAADKVVVDTEDLGRAGDAGQGAADHKDDHDFTADVHTDGVCELPLFSNAVDLVAEFGLFQDVILQVFCNVLMLVKYFLLLIQITQEKLNNFPDYM